MKKKILAILEEIRPEFDYTESSDFIEDGYLDSFDMVTLVASLEDKFGIVIDGIDIVPENFNSLESIVKLLEKSGVN